MPISVSISVSVRVVVVTTQFLLRAETIVCPRVVQIYMANNCDDVGSMEINKLGTCRPDVMNYPFEVDVAAFEVALVNAVQRTNKRVRYRGIAPTHRNDTKTGWA